MRLREAFSSFEAYHNSLRMQESANMSSRCTFPPHLAPKVETRLQDNSSPLRGGGDAELPPLEMEPLSEDGPMNTGQETTEEAQGPVVREAGEVKERSPDIVIYKPPAMLPGPCRNPCAGDRNKWLVSLLSPAILAGIIILVLVRSSGAVKRSRPRLVSRSSVSAMEDLLGMM